jgi:cation diffusion facilitator family transporter
MQGTVVRLAMGSVAVGVVVLAMKYLAWRLTGSVALYSDALESIVNVATAVAAFLAVRLSNVPADDNHPYGHHKIEYFSAVLCGALIVVAALLILREAWHGLLDPRTITAPAEGLAISAAASLVNAGWSWLLITRGRAHRSPALVADGRHLLTDVVTSLGVVLGILLALAADMPVLDPLLAAAVALNVLWSGWRVIRESFGGLMDEAVPEATLVEIHEAIRGHAGGALEAHDIRTRQAGRLTFVDFHLVVPALMTVEEAHLICDRIEKALRTALKDTLVTIHVEPENKAKRSGVLVE